MKYVALAAIGPHLVALAVFFYIDNKLVQTQTAFENK